MTNVTSDSEAAASSNVDDPVFMRRLRKSPVQRGLTLAALDALVVAGLSALLEAWLVPFLQLRLGASAQLVVWLTIAPMLMASLLGPVISPIIAAIGGNKRTTLLTCWVQIIGVALLAFPLWMPTESWSRPVTLGLCIIIVGIGAVGNPAFLALLGGMIPRHIRGRYHTGRMRLWTLMRLAFVVIFALIMNHWRAGESAVGLQIVLGIGCASRLASWWLLRQLPELAPKTHLSGTTTGRIAIQEARDFLTFLRSKPQSALARWTLVWAMLLAGVTLPGPLISYYWLLEADKGGLGLGNNALIYSSLLYTSTVMRLLLFPVCGRLVDRFGAGAILRIAVIGITLTPIGHAFSTNLWVLFASEIFGGIAWCLGESAVGVLVLSCSNDPLHRARLIGYHQSVCCMVMVVFAFIGGELVRVLPDLNGSPYRTLFLVSVIARIPAVVLAIRLLPRLKGEGEVRGLWRHIPGAVPTIALGRGFIRAFKE